MDIATHALTSLVLARGLFPRRRWPIVAGILVAGTLADVDLLAALFGPAAYFAGRYTVTHSIVGTIVIVAISAALAFLWDGKKLDALVGILAATASAAVAHLLMDVCSSDGLALLWPWRPTRFAADWLPGIDTWILVFLIAGLLLPEVFRIVSSEIGAKDKSPRGRNGAIAALALLLLYVVARATLHGNAVALLEPHTYRAESPRKIGAFPESLSLFIWRGVVDTQSNVCLISVPVLGNSHFDPELAVCLHKPEDSPALQAAQKTYVAAQFLQAAQFPRAAVDKSEGGYQIILRDVRDLAVEEMQNRVAAEILLDSSSRLQNQQFVWAKDVQLR